MNIVQVDIANKKQVRDFLRLPFEIYRNTPQWVPMFDSDARAPFAGKNKFSFYQHSEVAFLLAYNGSEPVGRIAAIHNRPYNDFNHKQASSFYWFECQDDWPAAEALFEAAFAWARQRGLKEMIGPKGFTAFDGGGVLVEGFQHRAAFSMPYNHAYYPGFIERAGFVSTGDSVSGFLGADIDFPPRIHELSERVQKRRGLRIARYRSRKDLKGLVPVFRDLYNGVLAQDQGNYPITQEEADSLGKSLLLFADPRLVKVIMKDDRPVGFLLAYADITRALQKTRGKLFPFGWFTLWREMKTTDWLNINGAGLIEEYRGSGGTAILFSEMYKSVVESGQFRGAEAVQVGVENDRMQRELAAFGVDFCKKHRAYRRDL